MFIIIKRKKIPVADVAAAVAAWEAYRDRDYCAHGFSKVGNGVTVFDDAGNAVCKISYNGRVWPVEVAA